jgi:hypothetical protein
MHLEENTKKQGQLPSLFLDITLCLWHTELYTELC